MKRILGYAGLFLAAYATFLISLTPAPVAVAWLEQRLPTLVSDGVRGRLPAGSARGLQLGPLRMEEVRWRFRPLALLGGRLAVSVESARPRLQARAGLAADGLWHIDQLTGRLDLEHATRLLGTPSLPLAGTVEASEVSLALDWSGAPVAASGRIRLLDLGVRLPAPVDLGIVVAELESTDEGIAAALADEGGPLALNGRLTLAPDGRYRLHAEAVPRENADPAIVRALARMGSPDRDDTWTLELQGSL